MSWKAGFAWFEGVWSSFVRAAETSADSAEASIALMMVCVLCCFGLLCALPLDQV